MSTTTAKRTPEQFAANYPVIKGDGLKGPITVGNIVHKDDKIYLNLNVKTERSAQNNAVKSYPSEWYAEKPFPFKRGDIVNVLMEDGWIKKVYHAKAEAPKSAKLASTSAPALQDADSDQPQF